MLGDVAEVLGKAILGGTFVLLFALLAETVSPKRFAGLFSAAPSVALGSLSITLAASTAQRAGTETVGMLVGAAGFAAFCLLARRLLGRTGAKRAAAGGLAAWALVAGGVYLLALR
jgi:uncharacterized membrane protein (GlpM family)